MGNIYDFAGPYTISINNFSFNTPLKYVILDISDTKLYDRAIRKSNEVYSCKMHDLFINNCHSHVANVLNLIKYKEKSNWGILSVFWLVITKGKYFDWHSIIKTYSVFMILCGAYILFFHLCFPYITNSN